MVAAAFAAGAAWAEPEPAPSRSPLTSGALAGQITTASTPLARAWVYAYQIADFSLRKVTTSEDGSFRFTELPAGLYRIIAFKAGFVPAVAMLSRAGAELQQSLDIELLPETGEETVESGFWSIRERIPTDVLRDIQVAGLQQEIQGGARLARVPDAQLTAEMQATTGVQEGLEYGAAQVSGGRVGIDGRYGDLKIGLSGRYSELIAEDLGTDGSTQWFEVQVEANNDSRIDIRTLNNRLETAGQGAPIDFESHSVSWSQRFGRASRSDFTAQYTEESNFHRQGSLVPAEIPAASRALSLEGSYTTPITERATLEAGFRYHDLDSEYAGPMPAFSMLPQETVELFGRGGVEVKPAMVVEYGLYSKLRDGSLSLAPRGGVILQLGDNWRASTLASHSIEEQQVLTPREFHPAFYGERGPCELGERYCYQLAVSRLGEDEQGFTLGAIHRQFGETLRLYFNRDFFNRVESLYMVRGDSVPEVNFEFTRRLAPSVLTRVESNLAAGGGGLVMTADRTPYENRVRYLVTSVDTQFEQTSTGVFLAFHRLEQELDPVDLGAVAASYPEMELERLQLSLTQDLGILHRLAWDWAVQLNMELSRGSTPDAPDPDLEQLRRRLTGGIQVSF